MLSKKSVLILISVSQLNWAQTNMSAEAMVAETANLARAGKTWKAEGYTVTKDAAGKLGAPEEFRITYQVSAPARARLEITTGETPLLRVCDGASQWTYYPRSNSYIRVILPQISPCAYPINAWPPLPISLGSPVLSGTAQITFEGRPGECQIVRGTFPGRRVLSLCVDPVTKLIRRYQEEELNPGLKAKTITFSSILRNVELDAELFQFHPPEGSKGVAVINWLDPLAPARSGAFRVSNEVTAPLLVNMVPPDSIGDTTKGPSSSTVFLSAEVNSEGVPESIKILRSSGDGPDEKAVESVKKWRFEPGMKAGKPVTVVTVLGVNIPIH